MILANYPDSVMPVELGEGDAPRLVGTAVPFGVDSAPSMTDGRRYRFSAAPELVGGVVVREHDDGTPIGTIATAQEGEFGVDVTVDILATTAGRDAHEEARAGVRNGFSIAFDPIASSVGDDGVVEVAEWSLIHLGHVRRPAFGERAEAVAASTDTTDTTEKEAEMADTVIETAAAAPPMLAIAPRPARVPSLAEYGHAVITRDDARLARYVEAINLAAGETLVANTPGIIPVPIVGPVVDGRPYDRPIFSTLGPFAGPSAGASWTHPVVTDPIADAAAMAELASANDTLGITSVTVTWVALKRSTLVSLEDQIYSEPAVMGIVGDQLARAYARGSEAAAAAALVAATGGNTAIVLALNGSDAVSKIIGGSAVHYAQTGAPADYLLLNPTDYAAIAGWKSTDGRPLFPSGGQLVNVGGDTDGARSFGGNIAGVPFVVSWALAAGQNYLVTSDYVKTYEGNRASISVQTSNFGVTLGIFGTVAFKALLPKAITPVSISPTTLAADESSSRKR